MKHLSIETRQKISKSLTGKHLNEYTRKKISLSKKGRMMGAANPRWKGGNYPVSRKVRGTGKYDLWKQNVMIRDSFTCVECGQIGGDIETHHLKSFSILLSEAKKYMPLFSPEMAAMNYSPLWDVNNGKTLCHKCHVKTDDYGHKIFLRGNPLNKKKKPSQPRP